MDKVTPSGLLLNPEDMEKFETVPIDPSMFTDEFRDKLNAALQKYGETLQPCCRAMLQLVGLEFQCLSVDDEPTYSWLDVRYCAFCSGALDSSV